MYLISLYTIYFFIYSFVGWVHEVIYFYATQRRFRNGGIVIAPLLPVYGIGALSILLLLQPYVDNPFLIFLLSAVLASAVEYVCSYAMEKWFRVLLWDYKDRRFNLHGRICLENSLGFGILALFAVYVVHPFVADIVGLMPEMVVVTTAAVLSLLFLVDVANAWMSMIKIRIAARNTTITLPDMKLMLDDQINALRHHSAELQKRAGIFKKAVLSSHRKTLRRFEKNLVYIKNFSSKNRKTED